MMMAHAPVSYGLRLSARARLSKHGLRPFRHFNRLRVLCLSQAFSIWRNWVFLSRTLRDLSIRVTRGTLHLYVPYSYLAFPCTQVFLDIRLRVSRAL
ncbi:hypothetical protein ERO13_A03G176725v2 [Gossypium hirsutum]|nr:hypothetical protein ERO13_A03G176725v2 [Gossypium hirsutum]